MRFHVARDGAVVGEFDEQTFRNKVFAGEITPIDFYWRAGFDDWRLVSEFRVARKTDVILLDSARIIPPALRQPWAGFRALGVIATMVVLALLVVALLVVALLISSR